MPRHTCVLLFLCMVLSSAWGFTIKFPTPPAGIFASTAVVAAPSAAKAEVKPELLALQVDQVVTRVAVAGATGRVGRLVVQELLNRGVKEVVALVRDTSSAQEILGTKNDKDDDGQLSNLQVTQCDLSNKGQVANG
jgi:NAD(P)H-binding